MDASLRSVQRLLGQWAPHVPVPDRGGPTLETLPAASESPRLAAALVVEGNALQGRVVPGSPAETFRGFLDGAQRSRVLMYESGVPVVHGIAAAVIRVRRDRRLVTWGDGVRKHEAIYAPANLLNDLCNRFVGEGLEVVDTTQRLSVEDQGISRDGAHPAVLVDRARRCVEDRRQQLERALAEQWCEGERAPLYIDGGLAASERIASSRLSVGVVQRHHVLYGGPEAVGVLASLREGERTSVFALARGGTAVWSWYLRLRERRGLDPTWGLVRIEIAGGEPDEVSGRADDVSRWVLAERLALSLPDPQWPALAYGIRDCKEMLRAVM